ncbi:MAG: hypothetical protein WCY65_03880 [Candidatus Methanomethylophilaceae archaeon]
MQMIDNVADLIDLAALYAHMAEEESFPPIRGPLAESLWGMHNRLTITQEVLGFYLRIWGSDRWEGRGMDDEQMGAEMTDRILTITKGLFVDVMSIVEKGSKSMVTGDEGLRSLASQGRRFLYLRDIMGASQQEGIISDAASREWDDLITVRNLVVHNNSIADRSYRLSIGDITISMRPNRMMKGPLGSFVVLSERALTLYFHWARSYGNRLHPSPKPADDCS